TTNTNFYATGFAEAVIVLIDLLEGFVDLLQQLALTIACAQFEAEAFLLSGSVGRIGVVVRLFLEVANSAINLLHQFLFPAEQDLSEVLKLLLVHVLFTRRRFIRGEFLGRFRLFLCYWHGTASYFSVC